MAETAEGPIIDPDMARDLGEVIASNGRPEQTGNKQRGLIKKITGLFSKGNEPDVPKDPNERGKLVQIKERFNQVASKQILGKSAGDWLKDSAADAALGAGIKGIFFLANISGAGAAPAWVVAGGVGAGLGYYREVQRIRTEKGETIEGRTKKAGWKEAMRASVSKEQRGKVAVQVLLSAGRAAAIAAAVGAVLGGGEGGSVSAQVEAPTTSESTPQVTTPTAETPGFAGNWDTQYPDGTTAEALGAGGADGSSNIPEVAAGADTGTTAAGTESSRPSGAQPSTANGVPFPQGEPPPGTPIFGSEVPPGPPDAPGGTEGTPPPGAESSPAEGVETGAPSAGAEGTGQPDTDEASQVQAPQGIETGQQPVTSGGETATPTGEVPPGTTPEAGSPETSVQVHPGQVEIPPAPQESPQQVGQQEANAASPIEQALQGLPQSVKLEPGSNPWTVSEGLLKQINPDGKFTPADIMAVDKVLCERNGISVPAWNIVGQLDHTKLPVGFEITIDDNVRNALQQVAQKR